MPQDVTCHAALASPVRRKILNALQRSGAPRDAQGIAADLGLHVTTARFHLDHLEQAGLVRRNTEGRKRRGRPRLLYEAVRDVAREETSQQQLIGVLAGALAQRHDESGRNDAIDAGRTWGRAFLRGRTGNDDGQDRLVDVLDQLGFKPESDGETITLRGCPFRSAAREFPHVVCSVHDGLIREVLGEKRSLTGVRLLPFVQPDVCVIELNRGSVPAAGSPGGSLGIP